MQQSRQFVDSFGLHWQVLEIDAAADAAKRRALLDDRDRGWLYFLSRGATRVLTEYPVEWDEADWPALEELCERASPLGGDAVMRPAALVVQAVDQTADRERAYR